MLNLSTDQVVLIADIVISAAIFTLSLVLWKQHKAAEALRLRRIVDEANWKTAKMRKHQTVLGNRIYNLLVHKGSKATRVKSGPTGYAIYVTDPRKLYIGIDLQNFSKQIVIKNNDVGEEEVFSADEIETVLHRVSELIISKTSQSGFGHLLLMGIFLFLSMGTLLMAQSGNSQNGGSDFFGGLILWIFLMIVVCIVISSLISGCEAREELQRRNRNEALQERMANLMGFPVPTPDEADDAFKVVFEGQLRSLESAWETSKRDFEQTPNADTMAKEKADRQKITSARGLGKAYFPPKPVPPSAEEIARKKEEADAQAKVQAKRRKKAWIITGSILLFVVILGSGLFYWQWNVRMDEVALQMTKLVCEHYSPIRDLPGKFPRPDEFHKLPEEVQTRLFQAFSYQVNSTGEVMRSWGGGSEQWANGTKRLARFRELAQKYDWVVDENGNVSRTEAKEDEY